MSLSKDALEYLNLQAVRRTEIKSDFPGIVLPKDCSIQSLEALQTYRNRYIATFYTMDMADFSAYVNKHGQAQVFIDSKTPIAEAIFDLGTIEQPGHAKHRAKLQLEQTPEYAALVAFERSAHSQQELAEWLEDWQFNITADDGKGEEMEIKKAIAAVRRVTITAKSKGEHSVGNLSQSKSSLEELDARSGEQSLPAWIRFTCAPYHGLGQYDFNMRVGVRMSNDTIMFKLTGSNFAQQCRAYQEEFMSKVQQVINHDGTAVYIGKIEI
jgi:uncharacterized protein YfdQ (DUF2303 family)